MEGQWLLWRCKEVRFRWAERWSPDCLKAHAIPWQDLILMVGDLVHPLRLETSPAIPCLDSWLCFWIWDHLTKGFLRPQTLPLAS